MTLGERVPLAPYTSFRVGGPARFYIEANTVGDVGRAKDFAKERGLPLKVLGGGTNVLVPDNGIDAVVVRLLMNEITYEEVSDDAVMAVAEAGAVWDAFVEEACSRSLWGLENLSGIPGTVGGAVVGSIGAYGEAVSDTIAWVEVYDLVTGRVRRLLPRQCAFGYRTSSFKHDRAHIVVRAAFSLSRTAKPCLSYRDLVERVEPRTASACTVRDAVRAIRAEKFPDLSQEGSAGSFFKNVIAHAQEASAFAKRYPDMPLFPMPETTGVKIPVAWLLDRVLHLKGYARGPVRLFEKQPLVVVALRGAKAAQIEALAHEIEERVLKECGITLEREVETFV